MPRNKVKESRARVPYAGHQTEKPTKYAAADEIAAEMGPRNLGKGMQFVYVNRIWEKQSIQDESVFSAVSHYSEACRKLYLRNEDMTL